MIEETRRQDLIDLMDPYMFELLNVSMRTQAEKIPGHGSPVCVVGPPGTAKTETFRTFAEIHDLYFLPVILSRIPSVDVGGIYVPDLESGELRHLITRRFLGEKIPDGYKGIFILFDEIGTAMPDQQAAIQSMIEDWNLEGNLIQKHVYFGFATNRQEDNCGSSELIKSLVDRLFMHEIEVDRDRWLNWALHNGIREEIHAYNSWKDDALHQFDANAPQGGQPCPRSWAKLSYMYDAVEGPITNTILHNFAVGKIGEAMASDFGGFCKMYKELAHTADVFSDPENAPVPHHNVSAMYAMISNIARVFADRESDDEDVLEEEVSAAIRYVDRMGDAMAVYGFRILHSSNKNFSQRSDEYSKFLERHKDLSI